MKKFNTLFMDTNLSSKVFEEFENMLSSFQKTSECNNIGTNYPPTNLYQIIDKDQWILEIVVAGFKKEDILIELVDGIVPESIIEIKTKKEKEKEDKDKDKIKYYQNKISKKNFKISVPFNKKINSVNANIENGILKIEINFKEYKQERKLIEINNDKDQ